jgi:hypothetical protein
MIYFEKSQPHFFLWPALAFGRDEIYGLWVGIGWLNVEIGWREKK